MFHSSDASIKNRSQQRGKLKGSDYRKVTLFIVGAGHRGTKYASYALLHPNLCKVVAVAEPREEARKRFQEAHGLPDDRVFDDWRLPVDLPGPLADVVVIATQDRDHEEPAVAFAKRGDYAILLEKPIAPTLQACRNIINAVKKSGCVFATGYVMRYTAYSRMIKRLVDRGDLGEIVCIQHMEPVGCYHFAHSYVRGHWRNESESSSMLLAKSCHDIDWLCWIMNGTGKTRCTHISSLGSLFHFRRENKPTGAGTRCMDCPIEPECAWSAKRHYLTPMLRGKETPFLAWHVVDGTPTVGNITQALKTGPYGRCVYQCDNDVVDQQVVQMLFKGGRTATFTVVAFTEAICQRQTRIFGTKAELVGDNTQIRVFDFLSHEATVHTANCDEVPRSMRGHEGGDYYLMQSFVKAVASGDRSLLATPDEILQSHALVFEAERTRKHGKDLSF